MSDRARIGKVTRLGPRLRSQDATPAAPMIAISVDMARCLPSPTERERWVGIERHGAGFRAKVSRGRGVTPASRQFPAGTSPETMQEWREDERARLRLTRKQRASRGTFEGDARRYLRTVKAMPTIADRTRQIELWIEVFSTKARDSITAADIREVRDRWLTTPRAPGIDKKTGEPFTPVSPATVNLRLRALSNLYRVLDGPRAENPVRDVDEADETDPTPRDLPYDVIARILERMPDRGSTNKKGEKRPAVSKSKIIARILAYTGLDFVQLERLEPHDVELDAGFVVLSSRRKGKRGRQGRAKIVILPLVSQAVDAFRDFGALGLWKKKIARSGVRKAFKVAAAHEGVDRVRIKDLRHSFGTVVVETTGDLEAARDLLMHESSRTTRRYTSRVLAKMLQAKLAPVGRHFGTTSGENTAQSRTKPTATRRD